MLVYPNTVGRSYVVWLGNSLLQRLTERGLIEDGQVVETAQARAASIFSSLAGKSDEELIREARRWERDIGRHRRVAPGHVERQRSFATWARWKLKLALNQPRSAGPARPLQLPASFAALPTRSATA